MALAAGACQRRGPTSAARSVVPRKGGRLRIGELGSSADTLDAARYIADADHLRAIQLYDGLTETDERLQVRLALAEEMTAESATQWVIRLKKDLYFHHGKPVTAEDVMFSIRRIIDPKNPYEGSQGLSMIDANGMQKLDSRTVRLTLLKPNSFLPDEFSQIWNPIVPLDFDARSNPVGTGAYRFKSFTPGSRSVFSRNPNYWREAPNFDEIAVIDFSDDTARLNALIGGEIDVMPSPPHSQMQIARAAPGITVCNLPSSAWEPFCLRADVEPFRDVRVRQALRLIPDRQQFITQVYNGNARLGNDLFSASDADYAGAFPQRMQDIDQAKSLLRAAGHSNLDVELVTSSVSPTLVQAAEVYAEQAKRAGVTVRVRRVDPAAFFGPEFLKRPFTQDTWGAFPMMPVISLTLLPGAGDNETGWNDEGNLAVGRRRARDARRKGPQWGDDRPTACAVRAGRLHHSDAHQSTEFFLGPSWRATRCGCEHRRRLQFPIPEAVVRGVMRLAIGSGWWRLILWRVVVGALTLLALSVLVFAATQALPGDAAVQILGPHATADQVVTLRASLGLDRPVSVQYAAWLSGILRGEFGHSLTSGQTVAALVAPHLFASAVLLLFSFATAVPLAVLIGVWSAVKRDQPFDHAASSVLLVFASLPEFVIGIGLVALLATTLLRLFPPVSLLSPDDPIHEQLRYLVLPVATLVIASTPYVARMMRASMIEVLDSDYIAMARLNGIDERRIVFQYALRNAIPGSIQVIGLTLIYLAGGIVVVETVFNYPGIGTAFIDAVRYRDVPTVQFLSLLIGSVYVVTNLVADIAVILCTPKLRTQL